MPRRDHINEARRADDPVHRPARKNSGEPTQEPAEDGREHPLLGLQETIGNSAVEALLADEGAGLPAGVHGDMEASLGHSFDDVRLHQGPEVDRAAAGMGAAAFTVGEDVYLSSDVPSQGTATGRAVLAEELAHVAQGVGADGAERLLPASDPAETEAHRAAAAVATGDPARVHPHPSARDAGGRLLDVAAIGFGAYKYLTEEEVEAAKAPPEEKPAEPDPTTPTPEQVAVITAGVVPQIDGAMKKLAAADVAPLEVIGDLQPVGDFLAGQQHPSMEGIVVAARQSVVGAIATLGGSVNAEKSIASTADQLRADAAVLEGVAAAAKESPAPTDQGAPPPDALTPAQATMLRDGPIAWLNQAADELQGDSPDVDGAIGKIKGAGGALGAMAVPAALAPTFNQHRLFCDTYVTRLQATKLSINDAVALASTLLTSAKAIISAMGGAEPPGEVPPTGGA